MRVALLACVGILAVLAPRPVAGDGDTRDGDTGARIVGLLRSPQESAGPVLGLLDRWFRANDGDDFGLLGSTESHREGDDEDRPLPMEEQDLRRWLRFDAGGADASALLSATERRIVVDVSVEAAGRPAVTGQIHVRPAHRGVHAFVRRTPLLRDYDPELACDNTLDGSRPSALGDPVVDDVLDGMVADVRPFLVDGGARVALEALVQWGRLEEPAERVATGAKFLGAVDLPRYRGGVALLSGTVAAGEALVARVVNAGVVTWIRLVPRVEGPPAPVTAGRSIRLVEGGLAWLEPWIPSEMPPQPWVLPGSVLPYVQGRPTLGDPPGVLDTGPDATGDVAAAVDRRGRAWLAGEAAPVAAFEGTIAAQVARAARTVHLEVRAFAGDAEVARFETPVLTGRGALLRIGLDRAWLGDSDAEVG